MPGAALTPIRRRLEAGRLVAGGLLVVVIQAYGAGAAVAVLVGDAETAGGKAGAAAAAVPTLVEEWHQAAYVVEHRDEIRDAVDYLKTNAPPQDEVERTVDEASGTLRDITTTFEELDEARDDFFSLRPYEALDPARDAWEAKPDLDSIRELADTADQLGPVGERVEVLVPVYYSGVLGVNDNLASDELPATLAVMAAALATAFVLGRAVGFWVRRGRPGLVDRALQRLGARTFRRWYIRHAPHALGEPVYEAARSRVGRDLLSDPDVTLDLVARRELEAYFDRAQRPSDPCSSAPRPSSARRAGGSR